MAKLHTNEQADLAISRQFQQHFTHAFFVQKKIEQLFSSNVWLCNFWRKDIRAKGSHNMLMKLTPGADAIKKFTPSLGIPF